MIDANALHASPVRLPILVTLTLTLALASAALGCSSAQTQAPLARSPDNVWADDAVLVRFEARGGERWSLRHPDDTYLCTLPCSYWVQPSSGLKLRVERYDRESLEKSSFRVPDHLPAKPGQRVTLSVDRTHGLGLPGKILAVGPAVVFTIMGLGFGGIGIASLATGAENTTTSVSANASTNDPEAPVQASSYAESTTHGVAAAWTGLAIGVGAAVIAGLSWYWFAHDRDGSMEFSEPSPVSGARVRLLPTGIAMETPTSRGVLTPTGLAVEF
jgi:hypothetical protein